MSAPLRPRLDQTQRERQERLDELRRRQRVHARRMRIFIIVWAVFLAILLGVKWWA